MEDEIESPMLPDSATPKLQNGEMQSSARSSPERDGAMPSLSPQPTAGNSFYGDQAGKAEAISRAVLGSSGSGLDGNFKNLIASFLRQMPDQALRRGQMSDSEIIDFQQRCVLGDRKINNPDGNSTNSDGSDDTKELVAPSGSYSATRSPCTDGRAGTPAEVSYSSGFGRREQSPYRNYLNPLRKMHKVGYGPDAQQTDCDARFDNSGMKEFPTSLEDNPLAAMLQKYAVVNGNDRFSMSPQKGSGAIPGPVFPLNGLPKKRPFSEEMLHAPTFAQPSMQPGPTGLAMNGFDGSADQSVFVCHACSFMARSDDEFQMHLKSHYDYYCQECGYHSRTKGRLDRHMKTFHGHGGGDQAMNPETSHGDDSSPHNNQNKANEPKTFKCRQCGFISYSREEHWSHNKIHIKVEKQLKCQFCSFVTEFKHHLEYHLRNHKGLKPFKCTKCNYSCVNKSMLNSHMKSHTNIYQFRCASCKYATKYSHSLKLHLINKKHVPAVVLNPDGSLPKDGSGNFELMSKRGPPRGPRGPRKVRHPSKSVSPPALMPVFSTSAANVMPFSQGNDFSWVPSMGSQSLSGQALNGVAMSASMNMPHPTASVHSLAYPLSLLSQLSSNMLPSLGSSYYPVDRMSGVAPPLPIQCSFCHASFSSPNLLAQHVKKEHVEKLNSFGVKLEARSPIHEVPVAATEADCYQPRRPNEMIPSDEAKYFSMSSTNPWNREDVTAPRFSKDHAKPGALINPQNIKRSNSEMESPLDLSARDANPAINMEPDDLHNNISPSSVKGGSAAASRKRSRKGKACKLDMISLTLQDNWEEEECPVEGSEASSFDSDCQPGNEGPNGANNEVDNSSWDWRKESPRPSDAADGDHPRSEDTKADHSAKNGNASDQEPVTDSLSCSDSISKGSDGFTRHVTRSEKIVRESPGKEYNMCQHCGMGFRDIVTYSLHMGYHGYNDPFQCNMCGHRAEDPVGFFVHIARVAHE